MDSVLKNTFVKGGTLKRLKKMIGCQGVRNTIYRENGIWKEWINSDYFLRGIQNCEFSNGKYL